MEEVFVRCGGQTHAAVETGEGDRVGAPGGRRAVQGEEESTAGVGEARAERAGDGEGARRIVGRSVMQDEGIDRRVRGDGKVAGQDFADVVRGLEDAREGGEVVGEIERAQTDTADIGGERVAHVRLGNRPVDVRVIICDEPRGDTFIAGVSVEGQRAVRLGRGHAELESGRVGHADDVGPGRDTGTGDGHEGLKARRGGDRHGRAAQGRGARRQSDVGASSADHRSEESILGAGVIDPPIGRIDVTVGSIT